MKLLNLNLDFSSNDFEVFNQAFHWVSRIFYCWKRFRQASVREKEKKKNYSQRLHTTNKTVGFSDEFRAEILFIFMQSFILSIIRARNEKMCEKKHIKIWIEIPQKGRRRGRFKRNIVRVVSVLFFKSILAINYSRKMSGKLISKEAFNE